MKDILILIAILCAAWIAWNGVYFRTLLIRDKRSRFEQLSALGLLHFERKHMRDAIRYLSAAVQVEMELDEPPGPDRAARTAKLLATLGFAQGVRGDYAAAATNGQLSVTLDRTCALGHCTLGMAAAAVGRMDDTLSHFDEALRYNDHGQRAIPQTVANTLRMYGFSEADVSSFLAETR